MKKTLKGQWSLVTGASSGIGLELARELAKQGSNLVLVARDRTRLEAAATSLARDWGVQAEVLPADLARPDSPAALTAEISARGLQVDVLVNNAGIGLWGEFARTSLDDERRLIELNVLACMALTKLVLPGMLARRRGRILNVASTAAFFPGPQMAAYYASKAFVLSFSQAVAHELSGSGVTVTSLCPGPVRTAFIEGNRHSPLPHSARPRCGARGAGRRPRTARRPAESSCRDSVTGCSWSSGGSRRAGGSRRSWAT